MAKVIGKVVATHKVRSLEAMTLCVIQPVNEKLESVGAPLIATDATCKRGVGEIVYFVASGDAMYTSLGDEDVPSDAAIIGIVDSVHIAR